MINSYHWQGRGLSTSKAFHKSAILTPEFSSVAFVLGFLTPQKGRQIWGQCQVLCLQAVWFWWLSAKAGCAGNTWGFWIPFCVSLALFHLHFGPSFHFSLQPLDWIFRRRSCSLNCLGGKFCSFSACCISHPENSKCIWKVSVKGFNHPAKPLSVAFKDYPLCGGGFWQWPGNVRPKPASAAGSPCWHSGRLSQHGWLSTAHSHLIPPCQGHLGVRWKKAGVCWKMLINQNRALSWENILFDKLPKKERKNCTGSILLFCQCVGHLIGDQNSQDLLLQHLGLPLVHLLGLLASHQPRGLCSWAQFH